MSRLRSLVALATKLLLSLLLTALLVEGGTRLIAPEQRFELIPNTFDPVCGVRQAPDSRGFARCPEYEIELRTNSGGLRNDREFTHARSPGVRRILCLGDSFTCGMGVEIEATFASQLDSLLGPDTEVLNAGVCGTGTAEQLAWYELEGHRYRPDVVVLTHVVNDWTDNTKAGLFTVADDGTLEQHAAIENRTLRWLRRLRRLPGYGTWFAQSHALNRFRQWFAVRHHGRLEAEAAGGAEAAAVWKYEQVLAEALLERLREACELNGTALIVMPVPSLQVSDEATRHQADLIEFLNRRGFVWLDLRDALKRGATTRGPMHYPIDGHWTKSGHKVSSQQLAELLAVLP